MRPYDIRFTKEAAKDFRKLTPKLRQKLRDILSETISQDPQCGKRLIGELSGYWSFRLSYRDRIVYSIDEHSKTVFIHRTKTHYGE